MSRTLKCRNLKLALRADSGLHVGEVFPLLQSRNLIGRRVDIGVPLDDTKVSRNHAAIDIQGGQHYLVDLGSTNGTYLNSRRLEHSVVLTVGDQIRVGSTVFTVSLLEEVRQNIPKHWKEATRAIPLSDIADLPPAAKPAERPRAADAGPRWTHLVLPRQDDAQRRLQRARILFGAFGVIVIFAAIATSFAARSSGPT